MASSTVKVSLLADASKFKAGMKDAETATGSLERRASGFKSVFAGFFALGALQGVASFLGDATKAAIEDERAQKDLALALKNTTQASDEDIKKTEEWIDATAKATGVADDELRPALETLTRATGDLDQAQEDLTVAMDIAAATGKPLQTIVEAMGKAAMGSVGGMQRLGIRTKDAAGETLTYKQILEEASRLMGGAAAQNAETAAGKMARLTVEFDELKEELGNELLPVIVAVADALLVLKDAFSDEPVPPDVLANMSDYDKALLHIDETTGETAGPVKNLWESFKALGDLLGITVAPTIGETYDVLSSGRQSIREVDDATSTLVDTTYDAVTALRELRDTQKANTDPAFAYADAVRDLAGAQAEVNAAAEEYGEGSPEHIAALGKVRDAAVDVKNAELDMADAGGVSADEMKTHLRSLGTFTEEQIDLIIADMERINAFHFDPKIVAITHKVTGGGVQERQHGGPVLPGQPYVVGERGPEVFTPATAGRVQANGAGRLAGGTPMVANITINAGMGADPGAISRAVVQALQRYERSNGPIPVRTRP